MTRRHLTNVSAAAAESAGRSQARTAHALWHRRLTRATISSLGAHNERGNITTNITFEHTEPSQMQTGTHLQGQFRAAYDELVEAFGEPTYMAERDGGFVKVWTRWNTAIPCAY